MNWLYYAYWVYTVLAATIITLAAQYYMQYLQANAYSVPMYCAWMKKRFLQDSLMLVLTGVIGMMLKICNIFFAQRIPILAYTCFYGADLLFLYLLFSMYLAYRKTEHEKPLKIKDASLRALVLVWIIAFLCEANMMRETEYHGSVTWLQYLAPYFIGYLPGMLLPLLTLCAFALSSPHLAFKKSEPSVSFYADDEETEKAEADTNAQDTATANILSPEREDTKDKGENE